MIAKAGLPLCQSAVRHNRKLLTKILLSITINFRQFLINFVTVANGMAVFFHTVVADPIVCSISSLEATDDGSFCLSGQVTRQSLDQILWFQVFLLV